ncbi:maggie [Carabus blaptoides fortunei]
MAPGENNKATMDLESSQNEDSVFTANEELTLATKSEPQAEIDDYADEPDETLSERLWGLTEMFPHSLRSATYNISTKTSSGIKGFYGLSRNIVWIFVSSSVILFAPLIFEVERAQMEDMQRSQQKQMLLGPNTAVSGGQGLPMPPMHR